MDDIDALNDRVQQSASRRAAEIILAGATGAQVRAIADLNHLDDEGAIPTVRRRIIDTVHEAYRPGFAHVGAVTPQSSPELFADFDLKAEVKYLMGLNKRYGSHFLRTQGYTKILRILAERHGNV